MEPQQVELPSEVASLGAVETWITNVSTACGLSEDARYRLSLAVHEAAANAVLHGNHEDPAKRVRLDWTTRDGQLLITVGDEGEGFTPPPPSDETNLTPSGRGLTMISRLTDGYRILRRDNPPGTDVVLALDLTDQQR